MERHCNGCRAIFTLKCYAKFCRSSCCAAFLKQQILAIAKICYLTLIIGRKTGRCHFNKHVVRVGSIKNHIGAAGPFLCGIDTDKRLYNFVYTGLIGIAHYLYTNRSFCFCSGK